MTKKQQNILDIALELFANEGFSVTSTSKIAKAAGVSEALIFRHFTSKKGLLEAIIADAEVKSQNLFGSLFSETNPSEVIKRVIEIPFSIPESEFDFWKLLFKLKWQKEYDHPEKMVPFLQKTSKAFKELNYSDSEKEAMLLHHILMAVVTDILKGNLKNKVKYKEFLLKKYQV